MEAGKGLATHLALPPVSQIGLAVRDVSKVVEYYSSVFGLGPFKIYDWEPDRHWFGEELTPVRFRSAKTMLGPIELELLQPLAGRSLIQEFLDSGREGLQHLGFNVRDFDGVVDRVQKAGFVSLLKIDSYVETYKGHLKVCYFDSHRVGGVIFEIIWKSWLPECQ